MIRTITLLIALILLPAPLMAANLTAAQQGQRKDFVRFVESYAHPLKSVDPNGDCGDLEFLDGLTAGAKIVALGASRHGSHEFMQLRRRFIECLVEHDGFTGILLETGLPYTAKLNAYIHGNKKNAEEIVAAMTYWSIYETKEFLGLLDWLKVYNAKVPGDREVSLLGIDMQDPHPGMEAALAYLRRVDPAFAKTLRDDKGKLGLFQKLASVASLTHIYKHMSVQAFNDLSAQLARIKTRFDSHRAAYIAKSDKQSYEWAREEFATVLEAHHVYATVRTGTFEQLFEAREKALAKNAEWQVKHGGHSARYILLSHNNHIAKSEILVPGPGRKMYPDQPFGMSLAKSWPGRYVAIAMSFYQGQGEWHVWQNDAEGRVRACRPDSLDAVLAKAGDNLFFVNLGDLDPDSPAGQWAAKRHLMRSEGAYVALAPLSAYDGLLFVRRLTQVHFSQGAISHLSATGPRRPKAVHVKKSLLSKTVGQYELSGGTRFEFELVGSQLYVAWNEWKFKAFPVSDNRFELRVDPPIKFKVERASDGSVTSMEVKQGSHDWQKATIKH